MGALIIAYSPLLFLQNPIRLLDDAQAAYHNKQYEKAAALYGKVIASYPTYVHAYVKRALCYFEMHQTERATEDYNKAIELDPQDPYAYTSRAYQRLQTNIHFLARADLEMASRLSKDSSELDILWGMYSIQTGDYSQATAFLTRAIKNQFYPDYAYYYRGLAHCAAGRLDEAEADWRNAANQATDSERKACALGNIGFLYLRRGQWKQAIDHSNRINAMHPDLPCNLLVHLIAAEKMGKMDARSGLGLLKDKMEPEDTWELNLLLPPELRQYLTYCQ